MTDITPRPLPTIALSRVSVRGVFAAAAFIALHVPVGASQQWVAAGEITTVRLKSGRTFTGEYSERTDDQRLWLRFGDAKLSILRPIEWSSIVEARQGNRVLSAPELRAAAGRFAPTIVVTNAIVETPEEPIQTQKRPSPARGGLQLWTIAGDAVAAASRHPRIQMIEVDAYLANWDADVESDGLVVSFSAIDERGAASPIDGTLTVELLGERYPPLTRGNAVPIYGRWTRQVRADETDAAGGYYRRRLEFQALHPEYHLWLSRYALVHVRLDVPGEGTFEASVDGVALHGFTPVRDRTQQAFGTRFLPTEAAGRGHRPSAGYVP